MSTSNRRQFLADLTMIGTASMLSQSLFAAKPLSIKIAYSAITWGGKDLNAMQDIASLGFKGIQLRANAYDNYKTKVQELKDLLSQIQAIFEGRLVHEIKYDQNQHRNHQLYNLSSLNQFTQNDRKALESIITAFISSCKDRACVDSSEREV